MSAQLLPLLLLKSNSASAPSHVSIYRMQPSLFFGLCVSREFVLAHSAKYPRKMKGNNISSVKDIGVVSGNCFTIEQEKENVKNDGCI